jgi:enoyl-CoA hydratase
VVDEYEFLLVENHDEGRIVRILLNRPTKRNAQNRALLVELDGAFRRAEEDDAVRVVILGGVGEAFSAGHDISGTFGDGRRAAEHHSHGYNGGSRAGAEQRMLQEWHYYFSNTLRWRNLRKITIAQVQGGVYAGGLMLMWACDLIVAADDTVFADITGTRLGMCGTEYFAHPWELGPRKTKELMLTGDSMDVDEAHRLGMVSKVFPRAELEDSTLAFARRIAQLPSVTSLLIKEAVNQTVDTMGFHNALQSCFTLHQLNHAHWAQVTGGYPAGTPEFGFPRTFKDAPPIVPAVKDQVRADPQPQPDRT